MSEAWMPRRFRFAKRSGPRFGVWIPGPRGYNGQAIDCTGDFVSCREDEAPKHFAGFAWIDPPGGLAPPGEEVRRLRRLLARVARGLVRITPARSDSGIRDALIAVGETTWAEIVREGGEESGSTETEDDCPAGHGAGNRAGNAPPVDAAATLVTIDDGPPDEVDFNPPADPTAELVKVLVDFLEYLKGRDARRSSE